MDKMTLSDLKSYYNEWVTGTKSLQDIANAIYQQAGNADPTGVLSELVTADYGEFVRSGLIHMVILLTAYFEGTKEYIAPAQNAVDEIRMFSEPSANICRVILGRYRILTQEGNAGTIVNLASETIWGMSEVVSVNSSAAYTFAAYDFYDLADWSELTTAKDRPRFFIAFYDLSGALIDSVISVVPVIDTANHKSSYTANAPGEAAKAAFCIYHASSDDDHAPDAISTATKLSITEGTAVPTQYITPFTSTDSKARQRLDVLEADSFRDFTTDINNGQKSNNVDDWQENGFVTIGYSRQIDGVIPNNKPGIRICLIFRVKNGHSASQLWFNATAGEIFARRLVYNISPPGWTWADWTTLLEFGNDSFRDYTIEVATDESKRDANKWESNGFVIIGGGTEIENAPNSNTGLRLCLIFKPTAGGARAQLWFDGGSGEIFMRRKSKNADETWEWRGWSQLGGGGQIPSENPKAPFLGYTDDEVTPPVPHVGDRFRVMSYNVAKYTNDSDVSTSSKPFKCLGDSSDDGMKEKLSNFRRLLGEVDADVCLVQENRPYLYYPKKPLDDGDVMDISSNEKGIVAPTFNGLYQPKYQVRGGSTGPAVYGKSKAPGAASGSTVMTIGTVDGTVVPNLGYAFITVAIGSKQVSLYSVHLTANTASTGMSDEQKKMIRKIQLDRILALAESNANGTGLYIVGGDTNIRLDGERENFVELAKKYGCTLGNGGRGGWIGTKPDAEGPLDNIICGPGLALDNFSVLSEWKDLLYSDHLPVVADIIVPTEPIKLEVCTYNIGMFNAGKNDTPSTPLENVVEKNKLIDSFLANNQFDILCMQEFSLNTKAESIGNTFRGHYDEKYIAAKQSTVCKYPFSGETISGTFTAKVGTDERPYTIQVINVRGVKIAVMNVHLSWEGDAQSVRAAQRAEIISLLSDYNDAIIFGDFNANGDNGYAEFSDFTNAGMTVLNGSSGYTVPANPANESASYPKRVLDNIIIKGSRITGSNARVLAPLKMTGEVIPDEDQYYVSDHKPFAATLTIT